MQKLIHLALAMHVTMVVVDTTQDNFATLLELESREGAAAQ